MAGRSLDRFGGLEHDMKVIGLAGWSGAGKTTLLARLIPHFIAEGLRVSTMKHAHHSFDVDIPGKDSWQHRQAGATEVLISSGRRWALMHELRGAAEPSLEEQLKNFAPCDVVIVEGWKHQAMPKIEVHRKLADKPLLFPNDPSVVAIATDEPLATNKPQFSLDDAEGVAKFIIAHLGLRKAAIHVVK